MAVSFPVENRMCGWRNSEDEYPIITDPLLLLSRKKELERSLSLIRKSLSEAWFAHFRRDF
jgi:hypothetical protein